MKPYVTTFAFSDDVKEMPNQNGGATMHVINPQNLFRPHFVPGTYSFAVTFGFLGVDPERKHKLSFQFLSPNSAENALIDIRDA
ncbi:hypothetical protein K7887_18530 [Sutcliffiella horikoshii]|uniref:hypothetical protein n=1 Tax=Sutcliffiella horikoshii TaxID=79883 RepID=UPI001CBE7631|nr:hypothetical protein [Sutcliffiella horikoshii]UAL46838.1 hypothetical protein K7887_18530 [Sutcliffiella horikoshii]